MIVLLSVLWRLLALLTLDTVLYLITACCYQSSNSVANFCDQWT
jgi:hypothetical protein